MVLPPRPRGVPESIGGSSPTVVNADQSDQLLLPSAPARSGGLGSGSRILRP